MRRSPTARLTPLLFFVLLYACAAPPPETTTEVFAAIVEQLPEALDDAAWERAPLHRAELLLQDLVEPRQLEVTTPSVDVRALTDGVNVAFRLTWEDATINDLPGASRFPDACAIQLPRTTRSDVPAPQMGEEGKLVEIAYWRASWQAQLDGRPDTIRALYPGATVDHYPFEAQSLESGSPEQRELADQYAPARALDNTMEGPRDRAVQDLLASGPGTLTPDTDQRSMGRGRRLGDGWEVVIVRPLPSGMSPETRGQIAFAIWDGEHEEVGARKMRSGWIPLHVEGAS